MNTAQQIQQQMKGMSKKEIKKFINDNGGFSRMNLEICTMDAKKIPEAQKNNVPEGAMYFEAVASDGTYNLNGYKIRPSAWEKHLDKYMSTFGGLVYAYHDMDKVVGKTLTIELRKGEKNGEKDNRVLFVTGYVYDEYVDGKISRGLTTDISTGHYSLAIEYENKDTNEVITKEEFKEKEKEARRNADDNTKDFDEWYDMLMAFYNTWIVAVTEAMLVEYSFVNVGANVNSEVKDINGVLHSLGTDEDSFLEEAKLHFNSLQTNNEETNGHKQPLADDVTDDEETKHNNVDEWDDVVVSEEQEKEATKTAEEVEEVEDEVEEKEENSAENEEEEVKTEYEEVVVDTDTTKEENDADLDEEVVALEEDEVVEDNLDDAGEEPENDGETPEGNKEDNSPEIMGEKDKLINELKAQVKQLTSEKEELQNTIESKRNTKVFQAIGTLKNEVSQDDVMKNYHERVKQYRGF